MQSSRTTKFGFRIHLLAGIAAVSIAAPAMAQEATDEGAGNEIVVTATKRNETIQDVPFSINAQTAEAMQKNGSASLEDVSRNVAGLTVQNLGPGQSQVSVRGVSAGQVVRDQPGVKEQVGVYLDESVVSLSLFTPDFDLFDLDRVETLRGPQGTLFGSGSVGGTVRYITKQPTMDRVEGAVEANVNTLAGGDVGYAGRAALNLPLSEKMAVRVAAYGEHFGGFINAIGPAAGENINDGYRWGFRAAVRIEPTEGMVITPRVVHQKIDVNGFNRQDVYNFYNYRPPASDANVIPERTQYLKLREGFEDSTTLADLTMNLEFSDFAQLTSVTSYIDRDILVSRDASALTGSVYVSFAGDAPAAAGGATTNSNLKDTTSLKQWSQELRLSSTGDGPLQWVIGGFYSNVDRVYAQRLPTPGSDAYSQLFLNTKSGTPLVSATYNGFPANSPYNADIPYQIEQFALFGEASYKLGQFKLTAGGRYYDFNETRDFISGGIFSNGDTFRGDKTGSNGFTPRFIASYEVNNNVTVNLQASKGFRLGGVNDPLNLPLCDDGEPDGPDAKTFGGRPTYKDETLWNYEAGVKASTGGVTFNAAVFYNDIRNLQVTADAGSCSSRVVFNVPKAHSMGLEMELSARPLQGLELSVNGSVIDAKFDSSVVDANDNVIAGMRDGNRLPTVPKFQMAATGTYTTQVSDGLDWSATASFQHVGNRYTQPGDQEAGAGTFSNSLWYNLADNTYGSDAYNFGSYLLPSYNLVNLSTGLSWDSGLSVTVYVNNLFDENPLLSLDRERGGRARIGYNIGSPRKVGMTVRQTF